MAVVVRQAGQRTHKYQCRAVMAAPIVGENSIGIRAAWRSFHAAFRWQCFERTLSIAHLRAYLKRLPDFEDMEAEERRDLLRSPILQCTSSISIFSVLARSRQSRNPRNSAIK
jgi:hypothetical protein